MFGHLGHVLCIECGGPMSAIAVTAGEAVFLCDDPKCNRTLAMSWPTQPAEEERENPGNY